MEINIYDNNNPVFQVDSKIVKSSYSSMDNYLIIHDTNNTSTNVCAIYFSGHSIYFPNDENTFKKVINKKNRFEWYGKRVKDAKKHIFIRDIHKQWYLSGINSKINSPKKLYDFLKEETEGYEVICIGSSAGGYAALLYASLLGGIAYAFSPRIEMASLDKYSCPENAPLYFRLKSTTRKQYMDLIPFIKKSTSPLYCFYPIKSKLDKIQLQYLEQTPKEELPNLYLIKFTTQKHGVPFPKVALENVFSLQCLDWSTYQKRPNNPIIFSIKMVGFIKTIIGMYNQIKNYYINKYFK